MPPESDNQTSPAVEPPASTASAPFSAPSAPESVPPTTISSTVPGTNAPLAPPMDASGAFTPPPPSEPNPSGPQVFGPAGVGEAWQSPAAPSLPPASPGVFVGDHTNGLTPPTPPTGGSKRRTPVKALLIVAVVFVLLGGSAAAYFGYYMNPGTVWQQGLGNTGKGYDKLVGYLNDQSSAHYSGFKENGSFKLTTGGENFDGTVVAQADGSTSTSSTVLDLGTTKLDLETRSLRAAGASEPDLYFQLTGIKSLTDGLGPDFGPKVAALDGRWIVVDHNLLADLQQQVAKQSASKATLKWSDVYSFLQAAGTVNHKYVFTTSAAYGVTKVVTSYGKQTVDGRQAFHYKVGFVGAHVKAYVTAMCSALQQSGLGKYLQQQTGEAVASSSTCKDLETSAGKIKSSDTVDVWIDAQHRLLYKVRAADTTNPAQNFVDLGLDYHGGDTYPFFIKAQSKDSSSTATFSATAALDTKANSLKLTTTVAGTGADALKLSGDFTLQPNTAKLNVTTPSNAESITDVLNSLGLGDYVNALKTDLTQGSPVFVSSKTPSGAALGALGQVVTGKATSGSPTPLPALLSPKDAADYRALLSAFKLP
jgi:hypothetical protein